MMMMMTMVMMQCLFNAACISEDAAAVKQQGTNGKKRDVASQTAFDS